METRRAIIIANPTAGSGAGRINRVRLLEVAQRELERGDLRVEIATATDAADVSDLAEQAARDNAPIVVAAGGDGTVNAVANGLMRVAREQRGGTQAATPEETAPRAGRRKNDGATTRGVESQTPVAKRNASILSPPKQFGCGDWGTYALPTLGVLPMGTGNVLAFNLGIASSLREACRVIRQGHTRCIDVGFARALGGALPSAHLANVAGVAAASTSNLNGQNGEDAVVAPLERHFLLMAGVGFDAKVMEDTSLRLKYVLRDFAYVLSTLQNVVLHKGTRTRLRFDEGGAHDEEAWLLMIGNAASYAWDIKFTQHARLDDGVLDVCLLPWENKLRSIQQAIQVLTGQHIESGTARYWKTKGLRIECDPPVPVQLDGDEWARTPLEISVLPGALQVLVPRPAV